MFNITHETCGCGKPGRYTKFENGKEVVSCNKYCRCLTYDELLAQHEKIQRQKLIYQHALTTIQNSNAENYEYRTWAKNALEQAEQG